MARALKESKGRQAQVIATHESKNALMKWIISSPLKIQQGQVVAAIVEWFLKQKPFVQTAVLSRVDEGMGHAYAAALRQLADEIERGDHHAVTYRKSLSPKDRSLSTGERSLAENKAK